MHIFVDASLEAYGAVAYLVSGEPSRGLVARFALARSKVAPLSAISVPRLELMAAMVGVKVAEQVGPVLGLTHADWIFWTDSMDVWHWVRGHSRHFKPFVAN